MPRSMRSPLVGSGTAAAPYQPAAEYPEAASKDNLDDVLIDAKLIECSLVKLSYSEEAFAETYILSSLKTTKYAVMLSVEDVVPEPSATRALSVLYPGA